MTADFFIPVRDGHVPDPVQMQQMANSAAIARGGVRAEFVKTVRYGPLVHHEYAVVRS